MKVVILYGQMRPKSNTAALAAPFEDELRAQGAEVKTFLLREMNIASCDACWACQQVTDAYGCSKKDDMNRIAEALLWCDLFVLATPIYTWYCTVPMKAVLDRHFGMNKYYGKVRGISLWEGKKCALITTSGYAREEGAGPFEEGIKRFCAHSRLQYAGMLHWRERHGLADFVTEDAQAAARRFACEVLADPAAEK